MAALAQPSGYCCYGQEQRQREAEIDNYCQLIAVNCTRAVYARLQGHSRRQVRDYLIAKGYDTDYATRTAGEVFSGPKPKDTGNLNAELFSKALGRCRVQFGLSSNNVPESWFKKK